MLPVIHGILRARENLEFRRRRRRCREELNLNNISDCRFKELFRMNKRLFRQLCEILAPHLHIPTHRDKVTVVQKILLALRYYATGGYQRSVGADFNLAVSQTSSHRYIYEVTNVIHQFLAPRTINFPKTRREMNNIKELFYDKFQFPGVIGAIDGTHIAIVKPHNDEQNFINRKGFHSINAQVICDSNLKFIGVNANYSGSHHDSFIWRQSQIRQFLLGKFVENDLRGCWLIGDSGYPLEPFLMTPCTNPVPGSPEERYNIAHIRARNVVERAIGLLKARFRCVLKERVSRYKPNFVGKVFNACAALHNFCLENGDVMDEEVMENLEREPNENLRNPQGALLQQGQRVRNSIIANYFQIR